jgi:hypothetical protein
MVDILTSWPPRDTSQPPERALYQGLCVFQYSRDLARAQNYKDRELPFVVRGDPHVSRAVERWNQPGYLSAMLRPEQPHRVEWSPNNQFLYTRPGSTTKDASTTKLRWMTFDEWLTKANVSDATLADPNHEHWYFRLIGCGHGLGNTGSCDIGSSEYLYDELPFFHPTHDDSARSGVSVAKSTHLYMGEHGDKQHGIHCRFGLKGVFAENHYDSARNTIVLLGGSRRYACICGRARLSFPIRLTNCVVPYSGSGLFRYILVRHT